MTLMKSLLLSHFKESYEHRDGGERNLKKGMLQSLYNNKYHDNELLGSVNQQQEILY